MSTKLKQKLEQLTLILFFTAGAVLLGIQIRKYYLGELTLTLNELIVTAVAISLIVNPRFLLNGLNKIIASKFNTNKNDREANDE